MLLALLNRATFLCVNYCRYLRVLSVMDLLNLVIRYIIYLLLNYLIHFIDTDVIILRKAYKLHQLSYSGNFDLTSDIDKKVAM